MLPTARHRCTPDTLLSQVNVIHCKNIRISTDIPCRVFHILTEPVLCMFVSVNRRNNEARAPHCNVNLCMGLRSMWFSPLCETMTSFTKLEVHDVCTAMSSWEVRTTAKVRSTEHFVVKFGHCIVFGICEWKTYIQTEVKPSHKDTMIIIFCTHSRKRRSN